MSITRDEVLKMADLARLRFSEEELDGFTVQFQGILDYIEQLRQVDVEGIEPTSHVSLPADGDPVMFREDEPRESLSVEEALGNAPDAAAGHFRVPRVL